MGGREDKHVLGRETKNSGEHDHMAGELWVEPRLAQGTVTVSACRLWWSEGDPEDRLEVPLSEGDC